MTKHGFFVSVAACFLLAACSGGEPSDAELTPIVKQAQIERAIVEIKSISGKLSEENRVAVNNVVENKEILIFNAREKQNDGSYIVSYTFTPKDPTSKGNKILFHESEVQQIHIIKAGDGWTVMK